MTEGLIVPATIEALIVRADRQREPLNLQSISQAICDARRILSAPSTEENAGAWSEVLAFSLAPMRGASSPWKTYFGPTTTGTAPDGSLCFSPDIDGTPPEVILHWQSRARTVQHPVLRARYADLAWDMSRAIAKSKPDPEMARVGIDAYLDSLTWGLHTNIHDRFSASLRALDLAIMLRDDSRITQAKAALLSLHAKAVSTHTGLWWIAFDYLIENRRAQLTDGERDQLVRDLEEICCHCSSISDPTAFDANMTEGAATRLIKYYNRRGMSADAKRIHRTVARTFEHFASISSAMLASSALQTAVNAFQSAGLPDESRRLRILMEEKIAEFQRDMSPMVIEQPIARDDMERFLTSVVVDSPAQTLARIASEFLNRRATIEKEVQDLVQQAPLTATLTRTLIAKHHVAAKVGSIADDPFGRLIEQAAQMMAISDVWLISALDRAIDVHQLTPGHLVGWGARTGLYEDLTLLSDGITAWFEQDFVKAVHVLVPQIESGLRAIVAKLGKPVTKAHPTIPGAGVAINMGDILYSPEITAKLGADFTLHLLALYCDPRGFNLRNQVAHGLLHADRIQLSAASRVLHTLLVLGIWDELANAREPKNVHTAD